MSKSTRSTLSIDAVAQAAAESAVSALSSGKKPTAIAGLAGFVLRLFRRTGPAAAVGSGRIREGSSNLPGRIPPQRRPPPRRAGAASLTATRKGGHHG